MGETAAMPFSVPLAIRVEDAELSDKERGLRIVVWSSVYRSDSGPAAQVDVQDLLTVVPGTNFDTVAPLRVDAVLPSDGGTAANPWPADAYLWFGAHVFAPSADGPLVGARAGTASLSMRDLRDRVVVGGNTVLMKLRLSQMGLEGVYHKMSIRVLSVLGSASETVRQWVCNEVVGPEDFVHALMPHHNDMLAQYVRVMMFPFTDEAESRGLGFRPSHQAITPIHAPIWEANVPVPQWAFWMQTGDRISDDQADNLRIMLRAAFDITLARHNWPGGENAFVRLVKDQLRERGSAYDDTYTFACAVMIDTCALFATQLYYKYDETYIVKRHWFKAPDVTRADVESYHDAAAMRGGDCEDLASLIHRVFRWLCLGDPGLVATSSYWRMYGGWDDVALDTLQNMAYWYVSGGSIGTVTAARVAPGAGGKKQDLIIGGDLDESLPVGGHMWNSMFPVTKMEDLLSRMNPSTIGRGSLRPHYPRSTYPGWIEKMPFLVGEGTGAIYPLILPLQIYMHTNDARAKARDVHLRRLSALRVIQKNTRAIASLQVQRWSDRVDPKSNVRATSFYRRSTNFFTDDFALSGFPYWCTTWTRLTPRVPEGSAAAATAAVGAIPGQSGPGDSPTWGVDMRDQVLASNANAFGRGKPSIAMSMGPATTIEEMASFKSRIRQLRPWEIPRRTPRVESQLRRLIGGYIPAFQRDVDKIVAEHGALTRGAGAGAGAAVAADVDVSRGTLVNAIFRRDEFASDKLRKIVLADLRHIAKRVISASTTLEYLSDDVYSVRLSILMSEKMASSRGKEEEEDDA